MDAREIARYRAMGRDAAASVRRDTPPAFIREYMTVGAVSGSRLDLYAGSGDVARHITSVPMTTACAGVTVGDTVVVDTYGYQPLAVGVIAR